MRIPLEHFSNTPVFALSPISSTENHHHQHFNHPSCHSGQTEFSNLHANNNAAASNKEKRHSFQNSLGISNMSVGSAPNSPSSERKQPMSLASGEVSDLALSTISGMISHGPVSLPAPSYNIKYATLPKK